jgi:WD40 repeat protein
MKFSNGGHMIAVAKKNQNNSCDIVIINSYSLEKIKQLIGHNEYITEIIWSKRDFYLYTCGLDGILNEWYTNSWSKKECIS